MACEHIEQRLSAGCADAWSAPQNVCRGLARFYTETQQIRELKGGQSFMLSEAESKHALRYHKAAAMKHYEQS